MNQQIAGMQRNPQAEVQDALLKGAMVTKVADTVKGVADQIIAIRAEEETLQAVQDMQDQSNQYDKDLANAPVQLDENENVTYDADNVIAAELKFRRQMSSQIRDGLSTGQGKRNFDKFMVQYNADRGLSIQSAQIDREQETIQAASQFRIMRLSEDGRHNDALEANTNSVKTGALGITQYDNNRVNLLKARDLDVISRVRLDPNATDSALRMMITSLKNDKFDSALGLKNPEITLSVKEKRAEQSALISRLNGLTAEFDKQMEESQVENTVGYLQEVIQGKMSALEISRIPIEEVGLSGMKYLISQQKADEAGLKSDPMIVDQFTQKILEMQANGTLVAGADELGKQIRNAPIYGKDQNALTKMITTKINSIDADDPDRRVLDTELMTLQGLTSQDTYSGSTDDKRAERIAGSKMALAFFDAKAAEGDKFNARTWLKNNKTKYYRMALKDTLRKKYGVRPSELPVTRQEAEPMVDVWILRQTRADIPEFDGFPKARQTRILDDQRIGLELMLDNAWAKDDNE